MAKPNYHLITIVFSHYNEKARWGLDYFNIPYRESSYLPGIHFPFALWHTRLKGKADEISTRASTPILKTGKGFIQNSGDILKYLSDKYGTPQKNLFFDPEVEKLEKHFNFNLGPHTRRVAYFYTLRNAELAKKLARLNKKGWQSAAWSLLYPLVRQLIERGLRINQRTKDKSLQCIHQEFKNVGEMLADGRKYLVDNRLSAADICFACMTAPILLVRQDEGYTRRLPYIEESEKEFAQIVRDFRETAAGKFGLRIFKEHRAPHAPSN